MNKKELTQELRSGKRLINLLELYAGQECEIFKAEGFQPGDEIIYIPDIYLNELAVGKSGCTEEEIAEIINCCYTGNDFIAECGGDLGKAEILFGYCDWQHPSSAIDDGVLDDDSEGE